MTQPDWTAIVSRALAEDRATEDVTTALLGAAARRPAEGRFVVQEEIVLAGLPVVAEVFGQLDPGVDVEPRSEEGVSLSAREVIATVRGPAAILLAGERTALNLLQHLSGVATATRRAVEAVAGTGAVIADTRKTTPGLREFEKYAVRVGGGVNHRSDLAAAVFLKDNHWALLESAGQDLAAVIAAAPRGMKLVVEVDDAEEFRIALDAGANHIMADNQTPETIAAWSKLRGPDVTLEASGGITLAHVRDYALAGADVISMGWLTHSVAAAEVGFELVSGQRATGDGQRNSHSP